MCNTRALNYRIAHRLPCIVRRQLTRGLAPVRRVRDRGDGRVRGQRLRRRQKLTVDQLSETVGKSPQKAEDRHVSHITVLQMTQSCTSCASSLCDPQMSAVTSYRSAVFSYFYTPTWHSCDVMALWSTVCGLSCVKNSTLGRPARRHGSGINFVPICRGKLGMYVFDVL